MAYRIALETEAASIGGGSGAIANKECTFSRAYDLGCEINEDCGITYEGDNELVCLNDLSKYEEYYYFHQFDMLALINSSFIDNWGIILTEEEYVLYAAICTTPHITSCEYELLSPPSTTTSDYIQQDMHVVDGGGGDLSTIEGSYLLIKAFTWVIPTPGETPSNLGHVYNFANYSSIYITFSNLESYESGYATYYGIDYTDGTGSDELWYVFKIPTNVINLMNSPCMAEDEAIFQITLS